MEGDIKDSTVQGLKKREIELIRRKVWRKTKEKVSKRRIYIDTQCKSNINTLAEELVSSENLTRQLVPR